jgi:competence protein ComEC
MRLACIAFVAGAWLLQQQAALPALPLWIGLAALSALAVLLLFGKGKRIWLGAQPLLIIGVCAVLGFAWSAWRAELRLTNALSSAMEGRDITVIGTISNLPYVFEQGVRFQFEVEKLATAGVRPDQIPTHLSLSWYASSYGVDEDDGAAIQNIQPGERWQLTVRLRKPHGNANPDGFDYEYWLLEQNLRATGYVRAAGSAATAQANRRLNAFVWSFDAVVERTRAVLRERILEALPNQPYAGVITALVVGDQRNIAQSDWQIYNRTGIGHLISISGLHITMLAGLAAASVFALWRRAPRLMLRLPAHKAAALAGACIALLYCLLAGFGVPAQRTLYMLSMVALALWMGRLKSASRVLCMALFVVILLDPWAVLSAGFWLSFGAVAAIFYVTAGRLQEHAPALQSWRTKTFQVVQQGVTIQWANAIAIPIVSLIVTPLALAGALLSAAFPNVLGTLLLQAAHGLMSGLAALLTWMSAQPLAIWAGAAPSAWTFVAALVGVLWCLAPRGLPLRWLGLLWLVPLFAWPPERPDADYLRLTALDVGQGMAVLIETAHHNVLYDTGPQYSADSEGDNNAGQRVILPALYARGIGKLDALIVSHNDNDHSGGALSILRQMPVDQVYSSLAPGSAIVRAAGTRHVRCVAGQAWALDGWHFEMLHPTAAAYERAELKPNARSCVLRLKRLDHTSDQAVLLAGDIERAQESELLARTGENSTSDSLPADALKADVLLVPHHGSLTSSSPEFLDAVQPQLALVQSGYRNRFGHPKPEVLQRYASRAVAIQRNDEGGAITVSLDGHAMIDEAYRVSHKRYWYGR